MFANFRYGAFEWLATLAATLAATIAAVMVLYQKGGGFKIEIGSYFTWEAPQTLCLEDVI